MDLKILNIAMIPSYSQNPIFEAQIPASRDLGLKTGIWALRLGYGPHGWDMGLKAWGRGGTKKEKEKEEEKIPHMCESIGPRPLLGRCPKRGPTNQLNDQPTNIVVYGVA